MSTYTIYNKNTGQISRIVESDADISLLYLPDTEDYIIGPYDPKLHYVNIETSQPTLLPARPSDYHYFNYISKQWEDPRTLEQVQTLVWGNMKRLRTKKESAGFTWDGSVFDSDRVSQSRIMGAVQLAGMSPAFEIPWTLQNNSVRVLNAADMLSVGAALGAHVATIFARAQEIRTEIYAASTIAEVEAITWGT